jgi:glycosyltransferase involved in cell wall biosynthesis
MSQPLQILHIIAKLDGYGTTGQLRILVDYQLAAGHQVQVLALSAEGQVLGAWQKQGVACRVLDQRWRLDPFAAWRLAQWLRRNSYDVLHTWDPVARGYSRAVRRVSATPCVSRTIAPGISTAPPSDCSREQFLQEMALPKRAQLIAVAGQLLRHKRIDEAIWSFELVRTINDSAHLLVIGDGPDRPRLERFTRLASQSSAIRFLGYRPDVRQLLPHIDVFWQTGETLLAGFEAMAAQVPLVVSDTAASRAAIQESETGYRVHWNDRAAWARQTLRLMEDPVLAKRIGGNGARQIAVQFPVSTLTETYAALYDQKLVPVAPPHELSKNAVGSIPGNH